VVLRRTSRLERKLKFSYNSNLNTNVCHKGLYTMGRNTKRPNTTKGPIKPKQKNFTKIIKEFIFYNLNLIRDLFEGLGHDSINCSEIPVTIPNHASINYTLEQQNSQVFLLTQNSRHTPYKNHTCRLKITSGKPTRGTRTSKPDSGCP